MDGALAARKGKRVVGSVLMKCVNTMQAATAYTKEQREGLLAAREALFRRMHQILEQRERLVATLQAGFPSTDTEHANAPLYVAVRPGPAQPRSVPALALVTPVA